jgi:hypothetical protein
MTRQIESWAAWILVRTQIVIANLDPEVLQWPGGSLVASFLWIYVAARSIKALEKHLPPSAASALDILLAIVLAG